MKRAILVALGTGMVITSATAIGIASSAGGEPASLTHTEYQAALRGAEMAREAAEARCDSVAANEREVCRAEAGAAGMVRAAEIENDYRRNEHAARELQRARIDARYHVERARCASLGGFRRDKCLVQSHATRGRALLEAAAPYELRLARYQ